MTAPTERRLNGLDHLRAFAITYVFLLHYGYQFPHPEWVSTLGGFGGTGVDLFFVLSGYLMGGQLLRAAIERGRVPMREFYLKRFFRIIPPYLFVVGLYFLLPSFREFDSIAPLWRFLTFTQNFGLDLAVARAFSHAWSLCIEEQFYLVLPLLIAFVVSWRVPRRAVWIIVGVFLAGLTLRAASWLGPYSANSAGDAWSEWIYYPTYNRMDGLLVGVCLAAMQCFAPRNWAWFTRQWFPLAILGLITLRGAYVLSREDTVLEAMFYFPMVAFGYGCLTMATLSPKCFLYRARWLVTSVIADLSYALYLSHKGVIHLSQLAGAQFGMKPDGSLQFVMCVAACLVVALLMRVLIERPSMKLRSRLLARADIPTSGAAVAVADS